MTRERAISEAKKQAKKNRVAIAVVNATVECAEDSDGPYGFAPVESFRILFPYAIVEYVVDPAGNVSEVSEPIDPEPANQP